MCFRQKENESLFSVFIGLFNISERKKRTMEQTLFICQCCVPPGEQRLPPQQSSNGAILPFKKGETEARGWWNSSARGSPSSSALCEQQPAVSQGPTACCPLKADIPSPSHHSQWVSFFLLQSKTCEDAQPRSKLLSGTCTTKAHLPSLLKQRTMNLGTSWLGFPPASMLAPAHKPHLHGHTMPLGCSAWGSRHPATAVPLCTHDHTKASITA